MKLKLLVYCPELDPLTKDAIGYETRTGVGGNQVKVPLEARFPYFAEGFVDADTPRDSAYTLDVVTATKGWGLADEAGNVLGKYETALEAEEARKGAKLTLNVAVPEPVATSAAADK
jgi:hypothetical protein